MNQDPAYRLTPAAALAATLLVIPATFLAGLVAILYKWFLTGILGMSWLPAIIDKLALLWFPSLLRGALAGLIAMVITRRLFRQANFAVVSYSVSALYITLGILVGVLNLSVAGVQQETVSLIAQTTGIVAGSFVATIEE